MISKKNIVVISNHLIFQYGLESLLGPYCNVNIVGRAANIDQAIEQVKTLQPDLVILDTTDLVGDFKLDILYILMLHPTVQVINMNLCNNQLASYQLDPQMTSGYQISEWKVEGITDLMNVIMLPSLSQATDTNLPHYSSCEKITAP